MLDLPEMAGTGHKCAFVMYRKVHRLHKVVCEALTSLHLILTGI